MFSIKQFQKNLLSLCIVYQQGPEGVSVIDNPSLRGDIENRENTDPIEGLKSLGVEIDRSADLHTNLHTELLTHSLDELARNEELSILSENIIPTGDELSALGIEDDVELNADQRRNILESRLATMDIREIPHDGSEYGPRRIIEAAYVTEIAEEAGIDPQLLMDLRAAGFEGAREWRDEEIIGNYESLLQNIRNFSEIEGIDSSQLTASEYMRLHEASQEALQILDPAAAAARGLDVRRDPNGGFQINPENPGYTQLPNGAVVGPPGSPSSFEGRVYQGQPNEFFGGNVPPQDMGPGGAEVNYDNYEVSQDNLMINEGQSPGQERLAELWENFDESERQRIEEIQSQGFFPILMADQSIIFIDNPSYDADRNGDGVSAQEAQDYEQANPHMRLLNFAEADAARQQAHIIGAMQTYPNSTPDPRYRELTQQRLQGLQDTHPDRLVGGVGKIMGRNAQGQIGMVGGVRDILNPDSVYQRSNESGRAHANNPNYADYSQMVQMRYIDYISASGELVSA